MLKEDKELMGLDNADMSFSKVAGVNADGPPLTRLNLNISPGKSSYGRNSLAHAESTTRGSYGGLRSERLSQTASGVSLNGRGSEYERSEGSIVSESHVNELLGLHGFKSTSDKDLSHHALHRFRQQQTSLQFAQSVNTTLTTDEQENLIKEQDDLRKVAERRRKILSRTFKAERPSFIKTHKSVRAISVDEGFNATTLGIQERPSHGNDNSDIKNPIVTQSLHSLGQLTRDSTLVNPRFAGQTSSDLRQGSGGLRGNRGTEVVSESQQNQSFTGSLLSMLHLDFLLSGTGGVTSVSKQRELRRRSIDYDSSDSEIDDDGLEEDYDNQKEEKRLAQVEARRQAILRGRFKAKSATSSAQGSRKR
jgi:hypothetical protein